MLTCWDSVLGSSSPLLPPLAFFLEEEASRSLVSGRRPSEVNTNKVNTVTQSLRLWRHVETRNKIQLFLLSIGVSEWVSELLSCSATLSTLIHAATWCKHSCGYGSASVTVVMVTVHQPPDQPSDTSRVPIIRSIAQNLNSTNKYCKRKHVKMENPLKYD